MASASKNFKSGVRRGWIEAIAHGATLPSVSHQHAFEDDMYAEMETRRMRPPRHGRFSNPRTPEEAQHEYYLVPSSMDLRYAPQYAELRFDELIEAQVVRETMRTAHDIKYTIYDKDGAAL